MPPIDDNDNVNVDHHIFALGTQVQAGLDDHNEVKINKQFWKDKLNGYALINDEANVGTIGTSNTNKNTNSKVKSKPKPKKNAKKTKKRDLKDNDGDDDDNNNNNLDAVEIRNKQRKFGSINREIIRKFKNNNDNIPSNDMKLLYEKNDWDTVHDVLLNSIKSMDNMDGFTKKKDVIFEYTDFGQQQSQTVSQSQVKTQVSESQIISKLPSQFEPQSQSPRKVERLTQESWSHPINFTPNDITALYDISINDDHTLNLINIPSKFGVEIGNEDDEDDNKQRSGIFTLSQVLGERCGDSDDDNDTDIHILGIHKSQIVEIEDSCGSECGNDDDDDEITISYVERLRNVKDKMDDSKDNDTLGTQQLPIELEDSNDINKDTDGDFAIAIDPDVSIVNVDDKSVSDYNSDINGSHKINPRDIVDIIEIPNSSDDENDHDKSTTISQHLRLKKVNIMDRSFVEIPNSSYRTEDDDDGDENDIIIIKRGSTQSNNILESINDFIEEPINVNDLNGPNDIIATNSQVVLNSPAKQRDMVIPTSSPITSQEINDFEPESTTSILLTTNTFDNVTTIPNSSEEEEEEEEDMVFMTALSQPMKIEERLKYFDGWTLSMLKKQLNIWGIKKCSSMSKKTIDQLIKEIVESISVEKWEWGIENNKKGDFIDFSKWGDDVNNPDMLYITQDGTRNQVYRKVHDIMKWDNEIRYEVLRYKPVVINRVVEKVELNNHGQKADKKLICEVLDKLGVCWTDPD